MKLSVGILLAMCLLASACVRVQGEGAEAAEVREVAPGRGAGGMMGRAPSAIGTMCSLPQAHLHRFPTIPSENR